jgi:hypothetical protein
MLWGEESVCRKSRSNRLCPLHLTYIDNTIRQILLSFPFNRWKHKGIGRLGNLLKVTQPIKNKFSIWTKKIQSTLFPLASWEMAWVLWENPKQFGLSDAQCWAGSWKKGWRSERL